LLNYCYSVLACEISKFVNCIGLDAYYWFCHTNKKLVHVFSKTNSKLDIINIKHEEIDFREFEKITAYENKD